MKLKNIKTVLLLILPLAGMLSCNKFLDVAPPGKLTFEQFWKNREQAVAAIAGIYSNSGSTSWDFTPNGNLSERDMSPVEAYVYWGEMRGDLLANVAGRLNSLQQNKENIDNLLVTPGDVTTKYTDFYRIINQSNQAIKNIPNITTLDPSFSKTESDQLVAEAYFLRAYAYFWLVRTFKEVPLILTPSETDNQDYQIPKSSNDVLLKQIIEDLTFAKSTLPEWYDNSQYPRCRATRFTAATVLADVYLWQAATTNAANHAELYDKAISNCDEVINSGRYVLLPGPSFGSIFLMGNTVESIFEIYANSLLNNQTNRLQDWFGNNFLVPAATDGLFTDYTQPDYRSFTPPAGPIPVRGNIVSYNASNRFIQKYNSTTRDARWIYYRYAEVLLMKAEAIAHRYPDDIAQLEIACELVNEVRSRAYGVDDYVKITSSSTLEMDRILIDERGREFIGEGKRWFDLMRFASRDNFAHKEFLIDKVVNSFPSTLQLVINPRVNNPESWYLPLNANALNANQKLVQNPYYQ